MLQRILALHLILASLAILPFALVARARATHSRAPHTHLIPDMKRQPKFRPQTENPLFADGRAMRPPVEGTVPRDGLHDDEHFYFGMVNGKWATTFPMEVTPALLARGQERFGIYCTPCHGLAGAGDGIVARRADRLQEGTWTPPSSYHTDLVRSRPVGHLFNTITNGIRRMPAYGPQIAPADRWAIVAYVRALQRSQYTTLEDVPPDLRNALR